MADIILSNAEIAEIYERNIATVYRVCFMYFKHHTQDLEDAVSETFLKLLLHKKQFNGEEHQRAWLIVTASNICKNMLTSYWKRKVDVEEEPVIASLPIETDETLQCILALPEKLKISVYMYYYEGYSADEIGRAIGKSTNSVWGYLHKGRGLLKQILLEAEDGKQN
ncbi:MAG: sigma-70 family RNA polymerase sigma factor [Oscillospiraceae bacterium]|jgi:RNA polymerase sigma-70 factor (ECF subfamily)|nr:sigma-70 family RNA polymerase sigma factor [Oscillospiraceae bacterium]